MSGWIYSLLLASCIAATVANTSVSNESQFGIFRHQTSGKFIHLLNSPACPDDDVELVIYDNYNTDGRMSFKFIQTVGHYGFWQHTCGKFLYPQGGSRDPADDTLVVVNQSRDGAGLFTIDEDEGGIIHRSGKRLHPQGGSQNPQNNNPVVLHPAIQDSASFEFVDMNTLQPIPVFPTPNLSGRWEVIFAFSNPAASSDYQTTINYAVGMSVISSAFDDVEWKVKPTTASNWFTDNGSFKRFVNGSDYETWTEEAIQTVTVNVSAGQTVIKWQYVFEAEQFGDALRFRSTFLLNTGNLKLETFLN